MGSSSSRKSGQGQAQPLLHAQGEGLELFPARLLQVHQPEHFVHTALAGDAPLNAVVLQVLLCGQVGVEAGGLHHGAGTGAHFAQRPRLGGAEEGELSLRGRGLGGDHADDGGLARAVAAHQAVYLPLFNVQVYTVHHGGLAVFLGQVPGNQNALCHCGINLSFMEERPSVLLDCDASITASQQFAFKQT